MTKLFKPHMTKRQPRNKVVGRIVTSTWMDERGVHSKKEFLYLKRLSVGDNFLQYDEAEYVCKSIVNWNEVTDGIYEVDVINISRDWETGYVDGWEYKLIPYKENTMKTGDKLKLTKDIWDDGEDHHPPGYVGRNGDIVIIKEVFKSSITVHHEHITDGSCFIVYDGEYTIITEPPVCTRSHPHENMDENCQKLTEIARVNNAKSD